ncbi:MAG: DoxX family membrane protein [Candidatus Aminicenantes bacterium]|nr:DoxX family membrane protein [Candidatus Aminicenantes bacterium]
MIRNKYILLAFRLIVGGVFVWSGLLKAVHPLDFAQNVENYQLLPRLLSLVVGLALPWVEMAAGLLLVLGLFRRGAALAAAGLLGAFIILISVTMVRGLDLSCGCFGSLSGKVGLKLLAQDIILLVMAVNILLCLPSHFSLDSARSKSV